MAELIALLGVSPSCYQFILPDASGFDFLVAMFSGLDAFPSFNLKLMNPLPDRGMVITLRIADTGLIDV